MGERVGFKDNAARKKFFLLVRKESKATSWRQLAKYFQVSCTSFQEYQYGKRLFSRNLFDKMNSFFSDDLRILFKESLFSKPGNWGLVRGGKITYKKHLGKIEKYYKLQPGSAPGTPSLPMTCNKTGYATGALN